MSDLSIKIPFLRQIDSGDIFVYTEPFAKRKDMVPHFGPNPEDVDPPGQNPVPAAVLAAIAAAGADAPVGDGVEHAPAVLLGSSVLPAVVEIGAKSVQLGTIVAAAHSTSTLTTEEWNGLAEPQREALLALQLDAMKAAAASLGTDTTSTQAGVRKPAAKKVTKQKAAAAAAGVESTAATGPGPLPDQSPTEQQQSEAAPSGEDLAAALSSVLGNN